jgi:hypothetical protein
MLGIFMKNILYFVLLVVFGSLSLFPVEQFEEKKIESVQKNENVGVRKQDSTNQKDGLKSNVDAKQTQEAESKRVADKEKLRHNENKASVVGKTISEGERIDKDLPNDQLEESTGEFARNLPNMANKEVNKDLKPEPLPLSADLNENTIDPQKNYKLIRKLI